MANSYLDHLLGKNENILFIARQHWLVYLQSILPEVAIIILLITGISVSIISFHQSWVWFTLLLILLPIISMIRDTLIWTNRQYVITNHRVIKVAGIFNKEVTDSALEKVNDVKLVQSAMGRLFGYGNIHIMTASELGINLFSRIANPVKFKTTMLDAKDREEKAVGDIIANGMQTVSVPDMILKLGELRDKGLVTEEEFQLKKKELLSKISA
jgi:uncharacterized membrane protein YdbT with pleckstrin-like domain